MGEGASTNGENARRRWLWFCVRLSGFGLLLLAASSLWLAPESAYAVGLRVRATTALKVEVQQRGRRIDIKARLTNNVNQGVPNATVRIELTRTSDGSLMREDPLKTDDLGYVERALTLIDGEYQVQVYFQDSDNFTGSSISFPIEIARDTLQLEVSAPRSIHISQGGTFDVDVRAALPYSVPPIRVELDVGRGTQVLHEALTLSTQELLSPPSDGTARARVLASGRERIETRLLGRGWQPLKVSFPGNEHFEPTESETEVFLFFGPELRFSSEVVKERDRRGVILRGELKSADGPLTRATLLVEVWRGSDWQSVGEVETDAIGRFETFVPQEKLPSGEFKLRMAFVPDVGAALRSKPLVLELDAAGATGWAMWLLIGLFGAVLAAMGVYLVVDLAKRWWVKDRRRRSVRSPAHRGELLAIERPEGQPTRQSFRLAGRLLDHHTRRPLPKVAVLLVPRGGSRDDAPLRETLCDSSGRFEIVGIEVGRYDLWARQIGYMSASLPVAIPHDGGLEYLRFELESVRERVKGIYQWLLESSSPDEALWGWTTPRELQDDWVGAIERMVDVLHAPPRGRLASRLAEILSDPSPPLNSLLVVTTALLEAVYFSEHLYPEEVAERAQVLAERMEKPLRMAARSQVNPRLSHLKRRRAQ